LIDDRGGYFVIHAQGSEHPHLSAFLQGLGLAHFQSCKILQTCYWRHIGSVLNGYHERARTQYTEAAHKVFKTFSGRLDELYSLRQRQAAILETLQIENPAFPIFGDPVVVEFDPSDAPMWIESVKFPRLIELERQGREIEEEAGELTGYLALLFASGEHLENAVLMALRRLGLSAEKTGAGFTVDILAETSDRRYRFGFEVLIKKSSGKLTQVLQFGVHPTE